MTSYETAPDLKFKLSQLKSFLDTKERGMLDDYKVFATQTSASANPNGAPHLQQLQNGTSKEAQSDMIKVMSDIRSLKSVLSNPIFDKVVDIMESLKQLSHHLNAHPSLSANEFDINPISGELILSPHVTACVSPPVALQMHQSTIETTPEYANQDEAKHRMNRQRDSIDLQQSLVNNAQNNDCFDKHQQTRDTKLQSVPSGNNGYNLSQFEQRGLWNVDDRNMVDNGQHFNARENVMISKNSQLSPLVNNDQYSLAPQPSSMHSQHQLQQHQQGNLIIPSNKTETLINNGSPNVQRHSKIPILQDNNFGRNIQPTNLPNHHMEGRLYRADGNQTLDTFNLSSNLSSESVNSSYNHELKEHLGSNEECAKVSSGFHIAATSSESHSLQDMSTQMNMQDTKIAASNIISKVNTRAYVSKLEIGASQNERHAANFGQQTETIKQHQGTGSCSPSTSVGSTVRLADECDSGPASYLSQNTKHSLHSLKNDGTIITKVTNEMPPPNILNPQQQTVQHEYQPLEPQIDTGGQSNDDVTSSESSVEMEKINVTLTKDENNSLGITIAGYKISGEKISGIFIRRIVPDSPAALSGKIKVLDQIYAVNGQELMNYSNKEAAEVLMQTGKVVTLDLVRYRTKAQFEKLQSVLARAISSRQ